MKEQVVIVGAGHAAGQIIASLRQKHYPGRIVLIGEESWLPYQRPPLSKKFLAGELSRDRLYVKPASFYDDPAIEVLLGTSIEAIDPQACRVTAAGGAEIGYTDLVLATGSRCRRLSVDGCELAGIHYLRGIDDVEAIRSDLASARKLVVVGAGYIGLEVAAVGRQLGHEVTVLEMADRVMNRVVSADVSTFYEQVHRDAGVALYLDTELAGFEASGNRVSAVVTGTGRMIPADLVIVGVGILPNVELAGQAGLEIDNGIVVDARCRTADPHIYAIGDCTSHPSRIYEKRVRLESVQNAIEQAKVAAANICGEDSSYDQVPWFWSDQYDLKLQIAGLSTDYDETVLRGDPADRAFSCAYLRDGRLIAIDCVNAPKDFMQAKALVAGRVAPDLERLEDPEQALKELA